MSHQQHRSLKYEYELYVEREIEDYKDSIPRSAILSIGDEAVAKLRAQEQVAFDELVLWAEVDRIITSRLRIPNYAAWKRRRLKRLAGHLMGHSRARQVPQFGIHQWKQFFGCAFLAAADRL